MAQESVTIFNDTVIKLSINQGLEEQRTQETLGSFTMGELAFTRDTGRVFVGDNSDNIGEHADLPSTIGGILVGNKYLGIIDSKPLTIFSDNGTPLSYEENTHFSGSQELPSMDEKALLKSESKFRDKSQEDAAEQWSNWPREAQYNKEYNAYNGDYMFDPYQSAFIFFDSRISGDENSETQPVVKKDEDGTPVSPETFIVDGEEIPSSDPRAINIKRRTKTVNYIINGQDKSTFPIYGNGYVIARILEPDNITIKLKKREFEANGDPTSGNNISHNILEIGKVSTSNMESVFGDDFIVEELVSLNKDIKNVTSITSPPNGLKVPQQIIFSSPADERGAIGKMKWNFLTPDYTEFTEGKQYEIVLVNNGTETDVNPADNSYPTFSLKLNEKIQKVQTYYINLGSGLTSSQTNPKKLILDERASTDGSEAPTISIESTTGIDVTDKYPTYANPYNTEKEMNFDSVYSSNFGITPDGSIAFIDEYDQKYYDANKDLIDKWEGKNPSLNFIRKPITIFSTSSDSTLYEASEEDENGEGDILTLQTGVNAYTDFFVDPYLYCGRKIISAESDKFLPKLTDVANYPGKSGNSTYFNSFTNTNIKTWNSLVVVLGNNHYKSLTNTASDKFFIDGETGDHNKTDSVHGSVFKTIENTEYDDNYSPASRQDMSELELNEIAVFGWKKESISGVATWSVLDYFDSRSSSDIEFYGTDITTISVNGNTNILENSDSGIIELTSQEVDEEGNVIDITKRFLMPESSLLSEITTKITYGTDEWTHKVDLIQNGVIEYSTDITVKKNESGDWVDDGGYKITSIELVDNQNKKTTIDEAGVKSLLNSTGGKININGKHNTTNFKDQKIIALVSKNEDEGQEAALKTYYMPVSGVYYVVGASLPGTITQAKIKESEFTEVTIDETVQDADKIVLPVHAQSLILEVEHKTSDNSPIGIFYANEFNQLGLLLSGLKTKETNGTNTFNDASVGNSVYTSSNGVYKQTMADSLATSTAAFHSLSQSITENEKLTPSCFYAAENEKPVFLSNVSETRLIEVPLHKSNYNSLKHFSLRFANIKPTTPNAKNSLALRVIGYRA